MNEGIIYIARNPEYKEDIYKVGKTERTNLRLNRMIELSNHEGVLGQFKTIGYLLVNDVNNAEKICHQDLTKFRYQNNREFFEINLQSLLKEIRISLSKYIIVDNLPKYKIENENKEDSEALGNFYIKIYDYREDFIRSSSQFNNIAKTVYKEMQQIKNIDLDYYKKTNQTYIKSGNKIPDFYLDNFWRLAEWTKQYAYTLEINLEHKEFIGFDTFWYNDIFSENDLKDKLPEQTEIIDLHNMWKSPLVHEIRKIELIAKNDHEYFKKINETKNKLKKIYESDHLYLEYKDKNSKGSQQFYDIDNYVFYAFFSQAEKREISVEMTDGNKKWEEKDFELVNGKTIFWKGSIDRVLSEFTDIIKNTPDYIEN